MQEDPGTTEGADLLFYGTDSQAQNLTNRLVLFEKPGATPFNAVVTAVDTDSSPLATRERVRPIKLDRKVPYADFPNLKPFVTVYGNLVGATQGKTEAAVALGNGDNRLVFQSFKVPKAPVTYLISDSETPPEAPELQIYVNDRLWKGVPSFFDRRPDEEIYIVREDTDNNSWVQFGDGMTGSRLPSGVKNVVAKSRTGTGAFGALKPDTKVQAGSRLERLDKIQMPAVAAGGSQPEDGDNAREAAPGKIQSLDRLVSVEDFESETLAISGVTKAAAAWQLVDNTPEVVVTVLMETGRADEFADVRKTLAGYSRGRGPGRFPIAVVQAHLEYVVIEATFGYDSTYREVDIRKSIEKALGVNAGKPNVVDDQSGLFSVRRRRFGQREYATTIAGTIQQVAGVTWAYVTRFESLGVVADPTVSTPPAALSMQSVVGCESRNVLSLYAGHVQLAGVAETVVEVKR
jgi:predicted phage baseplate assembly protein